MTFLAHSANAQGVSHLLHEHLRSVGALAQQFATEAYPLLAEPAKWAGRLHDLGKYRAAFQAYLRQEREGGPDTHHAVYGAALAFQRHWPGLAFAIAGHHAGLHDLAGLQEFVNSVTYRAEEHLPLLVEQFSAEVGALDPAFAEPVFAPTQKTQAEFYIRMLFSTLVDADFLDTEEHYTGMPRPSMALQPDLLLQRLQAEKAMKSSAGTLNAIRHHLFQQCLDAAAHPPGFFSLTVQTGGGKTLSSMAFALEHARRHGHRRVIVVMPYLSIIEQNAAQYRRIFDPENQGIVVEQHSAVAAPEDAEGQRRSPLEYAADNWDAPIIVTTSVQFVESLFANRPARCRKLHNIARSVVIFDEVQTLPSHLLNPLLDVLRILTTQYGVSIVFATATQPAFRRNASSLPDGLNAEEVTEITHDTAETFRRLQRVSFTLPAQDAVLDWPTLAAALAETPQVLCVLNVRRHACEVWEALRAILPPEERDTVVHLSSAMCAQHRYDVLGDEQHPAVGTIRQRLRTGQPCRVIATQLIEAGVDVDFPVVWRAMGPLDAIAQAAGRCNREGRLTDAQGKAVPGEVRVFRPVDATLPRGVYATATGVTETLLAHLDPHTLATDPTIFAQYFSRLYQLSDLDVKRIQQLRTCLQFRAVAHEARVIPEHTHPVLVPYGAGEEHTQEIRGRPQVRGTARFNRTDMQRLQRFIVNVRERDFAQLLGLGQIQPLLPHLDLYVLSQGFYHTHLGLLIHQRPTEDFLL